jgi:hypothetical protein
MEAENVVPGTSVEWYRALGGEPDLSKKTANEITGWLLDRGWLQLVGRDIETRFRIRAERHQNPRKSVVALIDPIIFDRGLFANSAALKDAVNAPLTIEKALSFEAARCAQQLLDPRGWHKRGDRESLWWPDDKVVRGDDEMSILDALIEEYIAAPTRG